MKYFVRTMLLCLCAVIVCVAQVFCQSFWQKRGAAKNKAAGITQSERGKPGKRAATSAGKETSDEQAEFGLKTVKKKADLTTFYNPHSIFIPVKYGEVEEVFNANAVPVRPNAKLIINIQDVHCHYEAQKHIAHILEELIVNYGLSLILVEGNSKDASLKHLRTQASRPRRLEVAEDYLSRGMISGEEYLDLISHYDFFPLGIEDRELYLQNLDSFLAIDKFKTRVLDLLKTLELIGNNLKPKVFSKALLELNDQRVAMEEGRLKFEEYCIYLLSLGEHLNARLPAKRPNFDMVMKTNQLNEEIDFDAVNRERDSVISRLSPALEKDRLQELLDKAKLFKNDAINPSVFYNYLQELLTGLPGWKQEFPELNKYIHYTNLHDTIDVIELFIEMESMERAVKEKLYKNDDERDLDRIVYNTAILHEIINLESAPYKYAYFQEHEAEFRVRDWVSFLEKLSARYKLAKRVPANAGVVDDNMPEIKNFYKLAAQRDSVFIAKTKEHMAATKQNTAVIITGGFHSKHVTQLFKQEGYSYLIIAPKITTPVDQALYDRVMKEKSQMIER